MPPPSEEKTALERARESIYSAGEIAAPVPATLPQEERTLPHTWQTNEASALEPAKPVHHLRLATRFLLASVAFFVVALGIAGYFFFAGNNAVSVEKVAVRIDGPTSVAGGEVVPLTLVITNKNPVALQNAIVEITFPPGTLAGDGTRAAFLRYRETLGDIASGASVSRPIKLILFGEQGQSLELPVRISYETSGSTTGYVKQAQYAVGIASTPLSIAAETLSETVAGKTFTLAITVRSNATTPLKNVVLGATLPYGFTVSSSNPTLVSGGFPLGTLAPGATKTIVLSGSLVGQDGEQRVFRFSVGTADSASSGTPDLTYMTKEVPIKIVSPFIATTLSINGETRADAVVTPQSTSNVTVTYKNTLDVPVTNATIAIGLAGSAIDYDSIRATNGFYRSTDHTILFSRDTDATLGSLAPGASGIGSFSFATLPASASQTSPSITLTTSVSGTRTGEENVPREITASSARTIKVASTVLLTATSLHSTGTITNGGPIPPKAGQQTTYAVVWTVQNPGNTIADGTVTATLPSYVNFTGPWNGIGNVAYNPESRMVTWTIGDIARGAKVSATFQVTLIPSTSQRTQSPALTTAAAFSGYDRFAGVPVKASADPVTTETKTETGYIPANAVVQ